MCLQQIAEKVAWIRESMKAVQSREKSYIDNKRQDLEFEKGGKIFFKVSQLKGIMRFIKKRKLSLWYVGTFESLKQVRTVAYWLALPKIKIQS